MTDLASRTNTSVVAELRGQADELIRRTPEQASGWFLLALSACHEGDHEAVVDILRHLMQNSDDASEQRTARLLLMLELSGRARAVVDFDEVGRLLTDDFDIEDLYCSVIADLLRRPGEIERSMSVQVAGLTLDWPFHHSRQGYRLGYHWLATYHNSAAGTGDFYTNYELYEERNAVRAYRLATRLAEWLPFSRGQRVLDAGCGAGEVLGVLRDQFDIVPFGVDFSAEAGAIATARVSGLDFRQCTLDAVPHDDGFFDIVISSDVLEHVKQPAVVVRELCRVVRPGGLIGISVPDGRFDCYAGHINFFSSQSLEALLEPYGSVEVEFHADGIFATVTTGGGTSLLPSWQCQRVVGG